MKAKLKELFTRYREIIMYLIFGVLTTLVGFGSYFTFLWLGEIITGIPSEDTRFYIVRTVSQILQWVLAALFAYITNRIWVFESRAVGPRAITKELALFSSSRLATLGLDTIVTFGGVAILNALSYKPIHIIIDITADFISKCAAAVLVIIANYVLSKLIVFRKKND